MQTQTCNVPQTEEYILRLSSKHDNRIVKGALSSLPASNFTLITNENHDIIFHTMGTAFFHKKIYFLQTQIIIKS